MLMPYEFHADTSELVQMFTKGHHGVRLDADPVFPFQSPDRDAVPVPTGGGGLGRFPVYFRSPPSDPDDGLSRRSARPS